LKPATENGDPPDASVRGLCIDILPNRNRKDTIHSVPCWLSQSTIVPGHLSETGGEPLVMFRGWRFGTRADKLAG
jgi:hypothetical protein